MDILTILIVLALVATLISLIWGVASMAQGGNYDAEHGAQLMNARVGFQAVAVVLLLIVLVMSID